MTVGERNATCRRLLVFLLSLSLGGAVALSPLLLAVAQTVQHVHAGFMFVALDIEIRDQRRAKNGQRGVVVHALQQAVHRRRLRRDLQLF